MRRTYWLLVAALAMTAVLTGCGNKTADQSAGLTSDSLLASNPIEQPEGSLAPTTDYQPLETPAEQPAETPKETKSTSRPAPKKSPAPAPAPVNQGVTVESGTPMNIAVTAALTSETANAGDTWTGEVKEPVVVGNTIVIPAGSTVHGVVSGVRPAEKGSRAFLVLEVQSVNVGGNSYDVHAAADSIIAGSARARNVGAVVGGTAAGALIGKAVGGSSKGALIGGLIGGAAATGAVAASKGYQATVKEGTVITFSVKQNVRIRS